MPDPRFKDSVIMLVGASGGIDRGLCVNRVTDHTLTEITQPLDVGLLPPAPLYWGGPVNPTTIWMLHDSGWSIDASVPINHEWAMTSHREMFEAIAQGYEPAEWRMFFGFCAWAPGQLTAELNGTPPRAHRHSWLVAQNLGPEWLFEQDPDVIWQSATSVSAHQAVASWL